ncbi:TPA: aspartate aminotransferase family protein [Candidatus Poribacteria bacterium]|nr:aspartate aminotransferase family protein [Candidatus Poribacteria bacterium]
MKINEKNIIDIYSSSRQKSSKLYQRAYEVFPSGATHDSRFLKPFPIYIERAFGAKKWDIDGNEYIDYWMGHGALLLGHSRPEIVNAVTDQMAKGTHYGACSELEVEWGEMVKKLIPSAEKVKFVNSGTEATLMAIRLARSFTNKNKIVKFEGHFHGWHDSVMPGVKPPYNIVASSGIPEATLKDTILCPPNDINALDDILKNDNDIACVIIEPTGGSFITVPLKEGFLQSLREVTKKHNVLLIFDEVVTGFRVSPGGAQEYYNVMPDLTALAKILAGGLPGGAVAGRADIMKYLEFKDDPKWNRYKKIYHPGTFNANPLSASAGVTALKIVSSGEDIKKANAIGKYLRDELNRVIDKHSINWCVYGQFSGFKVMMDYDGDRKSGFENEIWRIDHAKLKKSADPVLEANFRCAMLINGVDIMPSFALTSSAHTEEDVEKTARAFDSAIDMLKKEGILKH